MIIEFTDGKMIVRHPSGVVDTYNKECIQKIKTDLEQTLIELKVNIARQGIYLKSMSESKPTLLARAFTRLRRIV